MKVRILSAEYSDMLERMVNEFIAKREVINIKFSTSCRTLHSIIFSALIMYEDSD